MRNAWNEITSSTMSDPINGKMKIADMTAILHLKSVLNKDQCDRFSSAILKYKETYVPSKAEKEDLDRSNPNCWRGHPLLDETFDQELKRISVDLIVNATSLYFQNLPLSIPWKYTKYVMHAWCNVNEIGAYNSLHSHAPDLLSGCLYFRATGTGEITFFPHNLIYHNFHKQDPFNAANSYFPEDGDMIIFPSSLAHSVNPNPSNRQRINMAFNILEAS